MFYNDLLHFTAHVTVALWSYMLIFKFSWQCVNYHGNISLLG